MALGLGLLKICKIS
ncbi:Protein of unknown function [Streptococcus thermophilus]|nr:Protein of unknown function [Streptococcus thermophilus]